jgi:hypothetical protein
MKNKDLLALAALAGGLYGLNEAGKVDRSLEKMKVAGGARDVSGTKFMDAMDEMNRDEYRNATADELKRARLRAVREEPALRGAIVDSSGMPVRSVSTRSGYARSGQYKKGGMVKSASVRADGIAKRGKTKGRIV